MFRAPLSQEKFDELVGRIKRDTMFSSRAQDIIDHPAHDELMWYGKSAIPFVIADLRKEPFHWFMTLYMLTGHNPIRQEHAGYVEKMRQDWLSWYDTNR